MGVLRELDQLGGQTRSELDLARWFDSLKCVGQGEFMRLITGTLNKDNLVGGIYYIMLVIYCKMGQVTK